MFNYLWYLTSYIKFEGVVACEDANGDFYGVGVYNSIFNPEVSPLFSPFEDVESFTAIFQVQSTVNIHISPDAMC